MYPTCYRERCCLYEACGILCVCMHMWLDSGVCVFYFTVLCALSVARSLASVTYCLYYRGVSWLLKTISGVILSKNDYYINMGAILNCHGVVGSGIKVIWCDRHIIVGRNDSNSCYTTVAWICIPVHASTVILAHFSWKTIFPYP